ncbi:BREX system Lon protease-like protein BrxL [Tuanshanicoccus yangjingiae]|uniref:BREX system Lon protease-like protein BrxL n=1 Tax=Aerococcaceae bacterium zg-252 TaxID=2796928 RepID=UPI0040646918
MPNIEISDLKEGRRVFIKEEWMTILLRSIGMEADELNEREKWLLIARMLPLVENNFNLCELGPRSTGKSHLYKEISPNSILISGGQTTVTKFFYNMGRKTVGLVGLWDCVTFDEVAGINFKDKDGIQISKQCIFTTIKEEKGKYDNFPQIHIVDYTEHVTNKLLSPDYNSEFRSILGKMNILLKY